jgi:hypothetical protein
MVYVAGPMRLGSMDENVRAAILEAERLRRARIVPYTPQLSMLWNLVTPVSFEDWMELDEQVIARCDGLLRLPGESVGADREVEIAARYGVPVFMTVEGVIDRLGSA